MQTWPLASSSWGEEEQEALQRVIRSGRFTMGKEVASFEKSFADWNGSRYAVMVNSGSSANLLMVSALVYSGRLDRRATVAVPALSWSTTYSPLIQFGIRMKVVDVDTTLGINPLLIGDCDYVFAADILGNPCDFSKIDKPVIEDACESMGGLYSGRKTGTHGVMGSFSCFFSHHISTMEGGIIVTDDDELYRILTSLRAHGWTRDWEGYDAAFDNRYRFEYPGYSVRPTEFQGALGSAQLMKLDTLIEKRRKNAERYSGFQRETGKSSWFAFAYYDVDRKQAVEKLEQAGVECRPLVAGNILRHPMMNYADYRTDGCPVADFLHDNAYYIGNSHLPFPAELIESCR